MTKTVKNEIIGYWNLLTIRERMILAERSNNSIFSVRRLSNDMIKFICEYCGF